MNKPPTEKQAGFRAELQRKALAAAQAFGRHGTPGITDWDVLQANSSPDADTWYLDVRGRQLPELAFTLALPEPADSADCSEQISALKAGNTLGYARDHAAWGQPVLERIAAQWGNDPASLPAVVTVAELRAVATSRADG